MKLKTGLHVYDNPDSADFQNYFTVQMARTETEDQKQDKGEAVSAENETKATREQLVEETDPTLNSENSETSVSENSPKCGDSEDKNDDSKNGTSCNCIQKSCKEGGGGLRGLSPHMIIFIHNTKRMCKRRSSGYQVVSCLVWEIGTLIL